VKRFPYSWPEFGFILLVMVMPWLVPFFWTSETSLGFLGAAAVNMVAGFGLWLGSLLLACRLHDRKRKKH
jgi:hypothetical protein